MFGFLIIHGDHVALASPVGLFDAKYLVLTRYTARQLRPPVACDRRSLTLMLGLSCLNCSACWDRATLRPITRAPRGELPLPRTAETQPLSGIATRNSGIMWERSKNPLPGPLLFVAVAWARY
jgi:hypothetical protein